MQDILTDDNQDLLIANGDFVIGDSENQQQHFILLANKGEFKEFPEVGVGIVQMLNNEQYTELMIEAKKNLEYDGMQIENIRFKEDGKLLIDGKYKNV